MDNSGIDKKVAKQKSREATIKHYILGYILECAVKSDINVTVTIRKFLVYDLKIITVDTFIACLSKARANRFVEIKGTKKSYKTLKKLMEIVHYPKEEQIGILQRLKEFAENYEKGVFVNSKMGESSFIDQKEYF